MKAVWKICQVWFRKKKFARYILYMPQNNLRHVNDHGVGVKDTAGQNKDLPLDILWGLWTANQNTDKEYKEILAVYNKMKVKNKLRNSNPLFSFIADLTIGLYGGLNEKDPLDSYIWMLAPSLVELFWEEIGTVEEVHYLGWTLRFQSPLQSRIAPPLLLVDQATAPVHPSIRSWTHSPKL